MSSVPTPEEIGRDATWLVQALDASANKTRIVRMTGDSYRAASFLDDRIFQQPQDSHIVDWGSVAPAVNKDSRRDARWIFHIGHVGSTLIARLLGEIDGVLSVREPRTLRDLLFFPSDVRAAFIPDVQALMARTFGEHEVAILKATSVVSDLAAELIGLGNPSLFLFATPRAYIQTLLAGENSSKELGTLAEYHSGRLQKRQILLEGKDRSNAHLAAAVWACEMSALEDAAATLSDGTLRWLDFDCFLADPDAGLGSIVSHFRLNVEPARIGEILRGPIMRRYSKLPEYDYSPNLRRQLLEEAGRQYRNDIDSAVGMLEKAAVHSPLLGRAIQRAAAET